MSEKPSIPQEKSPQEILERARGAQAKAEAERMQAARAALELGLSRWEELAKKVAEDDRLSGEFKAAILSAEVEIAAATERQQPAPELEAALRELKAERQILFVKLEGSRRDLHSLETRPDIKAHLAELAAQEAKKAEHAKKAEELEQLEKDMNEVLRLEQEVGAAGRLFTEFLKQDNGWALRFDYEPLVDKLPTNHKEAKQLRDTLDRIEQAKSQLHALEGTWFHGGEKKALRQEIQEEEAIRKQLKANGERSNRVHEEFERLITELEQKVYLLYQALEKIQVAQVKKSESTRPAGGTIASLHWEKDKPMTATALLRERFPFVGNFDLPNKRITTKRHEIARFYGYTAEMRKLPEKK